jgi:hypothetical protein
MTGRGGRGGYRRIYKYELHGGDEITIMMPADAEILAFQAQNNVPVIWVGVDLDQEPIPRTFFLKCTGFDYVADAIYHGTAQLHDGRLVFHLFETPPRDGAEDGEVGP